MSELVFVSYSRTDKKFVDRLVADLHRLGVRVWRDTAEILPGQNWLEQIEAAIASIKVFLFVASRHSVGSGWIEHELQHVLEKTDSLIVPLILDEIGERQLPTFLRAIEWIDFREGYENSFNTLVNALPDATRGSEPAPPPEAQSKGYVFLSYAEEDADFVGTLKDFLSDHDYAYWDYEESERRERQRRSATLSRTHGVSLGSK